ncbi:hypothetical protein [Streptomyces antarcticus]|uniref:hypothetical protein n=1 Tax=Streptomyces antarcticus TaxID=2996458 RepID=UPI002271FDFB|nr:MULTISPECIES: hypothetical protein [unclassified Streptomyces]MCY0947689.1 hypothetical protein [Streptomyces sp. H34-AA3]MCZ4085554.1 hypothetical protein [Streptomyces sp. H34-S5]
MTAAAALAGTALLGLLVLPEASDAFWTRHLPAAGRTLLSVPGRAQPWVWCVPLLTALIAAVRGRADGTDPDDLTDLTDLTDPARVSVPVPRRSAALPGTGVAGRAVSRSPGSRPRP